MQVLNEIKQMLNARGIYIIGTGYVGDKVGDKLSGLNYAISFAIKYPKFIVDQIKDGPSFTYFHQYRTMNANLDSCAMAVQSMLVENGNEALYIPASQSNPKAKFDGLFSHKIAAVRSGLGFIGKNNLFISTEYGSAIRLSTVLTNLELEKSEEVPNQCGDCKKCFNACPSGAIFGKVSDSHDRQEVFCPETCSRYMKDNFKHIGRGVVCGICIGVCPFSGGKK